MELPASVTAPIFTTVAKLLADATATEGTFMAQLSDLGLDPSTLAPSFAAACRRLIAAGVSGDTRAAAFWVPGRIELMGKHTDYAGGRSLLCAVNRGFAVVSADRADALCRIMVSFELSGVSDEATVSLRGGKDAGADEGQADWARYPAVTAQRLARNFGLSLGVDLALSCDLPEVRGGGGREPGRRVGG